MRKKNLLDEILIPFLAVITALFIGAFVILWSGQSPLFAYLVLFKGSLGSLRGISETIVNTTPLIFTGLAVAFAFRCGLFNIGGEGQYIVGLMAAAVAGFAIKGLPSFLHIMVVIAAGGLAGGLWASIPGILKAKLGVHEVINTIMMNYIALYTTHYLVNGPFKAEGPLPVTPRIQPTAELYRFSPIMRANTGIFIALLCAVVAYYLLWETTLGYEIRAVGLNQSAAEYGGISVPKNMVLAMIISGAFAGIAGSVQVAGVQHRFYDIFSFTGYGFDGIAVALLGRNHPLGVVFAALLFGILATGSMQMQSVAGIPKEVTGLIQFMIIIFVIADELIRYIYRVKKKEVVANG